MIIKIPQVQSKAQGSGLAVIWGHRLSNQIMSPSFITEPLTLKLEQISFDFMKSGGFILSTTNSSGAVWIPPAKDLDLSSSLLLSFYTLSLFLAFSTLACSTPDCHVVSAMQPASCEAKWGQQPNGAPACPGLWATQWEAVRYTWTSKRHEGSIAPVSFGFLRADLSKLFRLLSVFVAGGAEMDPVFHCAAPCTRLASIPLPKSLQSC